MMPSRGDHCGCDARQSSSSRTSSSYAIVATTDLDVLEPVEQRRERIAALRGGGARLLPSG